ncbi:ATP-binding protein [Acanthopleuribacter pedis]|uniref:histidine kinase n=1 Tax=Acanthopleuribacter pedis TaxID=442870 RepID=A0A8J7Q140_9BACT|nr:ATP-binding protein [Acanthopleuribacter pedis]MBO1317280.1 response regulator [Acanthopleuribacter pedis]MBO1318587.1 response regulator [Acanthopleuribacter pedis]
MQIAPSETDKHTSSLNSTRRLKILVVEDDIDDFFLLKKYLRSNRYIYDVSHVENIQDALLFDLTEYDLILLDYKLRSNTSLDLIAKARKQNLSLPIILITNLNDERLDDLSFSMGADDFVPKNELSPTLLNRTIHHCLERERKNRERNRAQLEFRNLLEVSTTTLHNTANILNTLMATLESIEELVKASRGVDLMKISDLLRGDEKKLTKILSSPEKSEKILTFIDALSNVLETERSQVLDETALAIRKTRAMRDVIQTQQSKASDGLYLEPISFQDLIQEAVELIKEDPLSHGVLFEKVFNGNPIIRGPKTLLTHAIFNILKNSLEAMSDSPEKKITFYLDTKAAADLRIVDTGHGISPKIIKDLFSPGFSTKPNGKGLGLQFCRKIIEELGGTLEIDTGLKVGTGITIIVPLYSSPLQEKLH